MDWHAKEHDPQDQPRDLAVYSRSQRRAVLDHWLSHDLVRNSPGIEQMEAADSDSDPEESELFSQALSALYGLQHKVEDPHGPLWLSYREEMHAPYEQWTPSFLTKVAQAEYEWPRRVVLALGSCHLRDLDLPPLVDGVLRNAWLRANVVKVLLNHNSLTRASLPHVARLLSACPKLEYATLAITSMTFSDFEELASLVDPSVFRLVHFSVW